MQKDSVFLIFWVAGILCFILGISMPAFMLEPGFGPWWLDWPIKEFLGEDGEAKSYSVLSSVLKLVSSSGPGNMGLGIILFVFSVAFPILKYSLLIIAFFKSNESKRAKNILEKGHWSLLDVFVVTIFVVSFKEFPGGTAIRPMIGIYFFAASVILSFIMHKILKRSVSS